jgi:LysR family hydrogen peroxide-inducible transcriptional activator
MDLRQLNALVAVADHASFSAAARALHTVQSNVSTHVARLERELGVTLVNRSGGALTDEGEIVVERARRIQSELDALTDDVAAVRDEVSGSVNAGMIGSTARWLAPGVLNAMNDAHPKVNLVLHDAATSALAPLLAAGQVDLGVLALPIDDPDLVGEPLFEEESVLVAPNDHVLAKHKGALTITDLADHELLLLPKGTTFRDELDTVAESAGVELQTRAEVDGMRLVASMAFHGYAPAVVPASAAPAGILGDWSAMPVEGLPRRVVGLAHRKRALLSAPSRAFVAILAQVVASRASDQPGIHPSPELLTRIDSAH